MTGRNLSEETQREVGGEPGVDACSGRRVSGLRPRHPAVGRSTDLACGGRVSAFDKAC
jgi:hypothetical protein